jgi:hypothetical protein
MAERRNNDDRERRGSDQHGSSRSGSSKQQGSGSEQRSDSSDLKRREYRDKEGDVHHHTHEYMERHGDKGGGGTKRS